MQKNSLIDIIICAALSLLLTYLLSEVFDVQLLKEGLQAAY